MALLEKAAGQGHAYAMLWLSRMHYRMNEDERAMECLSKGAEAGLPNAMHNFACGLPEGKGMAAPDYVAAAGWYKRAADGGDAKAANNLSHMYQLGCGKVWQIMLATSSPLFRPSFIEECVTRRGEQYLPGSRARRHVQQAAVTAMAAQGRRTWRLPSVLGTRR